MSCHVMPRGMKGLSSQRSRAGFCPRGVKRLKKRRTRNDLLYTRTLIQPRNCGKLPGPFFGKIAKICKKYQNIASATKGRASRAPFAGNFCMTAFLRFLHDCIFLEGVGVYYFFLTVAKSHRKWLKYVPSYLKTV